jgi:hypothetical protein
MRRVCTLCVLCLSMTGAVAWGANSISRRAATQSHQVQHNRQTSQRGRRHHWKPGSFGNTKSAHASAVKTTVLSARTNLMYAAMALSTATGNPVLLGDQNVQPTQDGGQGASEAFGYTASATGTATNISVYLDTTDGVRLGLYADRSSKPGVRLDKGSVSANAAGWVAVPLTGGVHIASGTQYWIAIAATSNATTVGYRDSGSSGLSLDYSGRGLENPYGIQSQWSSNPASVYVGGTSSAPPPPVAPADTILPAITGAAQQANALTASTGTWSGTAPITYTYQWQQNGTTTIANATSSSYTPSVADVGQTLDVVVKATNAAGNTSATSVPTAVVAGSPPPSPPSNTALPVVTGTATQGQILQDGSGTWTGSPTSFAYQWENCSGGGATCTNIAGATSSSYLLSSTDVGDTIRVLVTATNAAGSGAATSGPTAMVAALPVSAPSNTALEVVSGIDTQGQSLTTTNGSWTNSPTGYTYQWQDCNSTGSGCTNVSGASLSSYALASGDVGHTMRAVVIATNASGSGSATSAQSPMIAAQTTGNVTYQPIDGGSTYFAHLGAASAWMDGHILAGAWLEQPQSATEVGYSAAMGDNIYWNLSGSSVDYNLIRAGGMHISAPSHDANSGSETVMYDGHDEDDMNFGPGVNAWNDNGTYNQSACVPSGSQCGYTASASGFNSRPFTGTAIHQGYGKGVLFWETDPQAAKFMTYTDVPSADSYWLTDQDLAIPGQGGCALLPNSPTACTNGNATGLTLAQSELPANYAYDVTRLEQLDLQNGASKPIAVDVEVGCPLQGDNSGHCVNVAQFTAAAWHALIAGARGIIWFQHSFSGPCIDFRTLMDGSNPNAGANLYNCQITPGETLHNLVQGMTAFNAKVSSLNGVLLSPTAVGYVNTTADVSTTAKAYGGNCYVFAGSGKPATPPPANQSASFTLADSYTGPVTVFAENRTIQATNGVFQDTFADANAVHIYQLNGSTCG